MKHFILKIYLLKVINSESSSKEHCQTLWYKNWPALPSFFHQIVLLFKNEKDHLIKDRVTIHSITQIGHFESEKVTVNVGP